MVKAILKTLFGTIILTIGLIIGREFIGTSLIRFTLLIPIGGFILGYNIAGYYNKSLFRNNHYIDNKKKLFITILAFLLLIGMYYAEYELGYKQDFIKNIEAEYSTVNDMSFLEYIKHEKDYHTFKINKIEKYQTQKAFVIWNNIYFYLNILLFWLGVGAYNTTYNDRNYCSRCHRYHKTESIIGLNKNAYEELDKLREDAEKYPQVLVDYMHKFPIIPEKEDRHEEYIECELDYCDVCYSSYVNFELHINKNNKEVKKALYPRIQFRDPITVKEIIIEMEKDHDI